MELWKAHRDANAPEVVVTLDDIFDEAELIASDNTNKIIYMNPECAQTSEYNMEFYLSGANSEVARVIRAILRRVDEEIMNKENTELPTVVSALNESTDNQTCFSRLWTRILNLIFRRERYNDESGVQNDSTSEDSFIKCCCCGMLCRTRRSCEANTSDESSFVRAYSDWPDLFKESEVIKSSGSWGWRPLRVKRRRREPN